VEVADYLELERFATWGFSGGGPFALACAALLPGRVSCAVVMASLAPYDAAGLDWAARFSEQVQAEIELFFTDPVAYRKMHSEVAADYGARLSRPESWHARWKEAAGRDEAHGEAMAEYLALDFREALLLGDEGWFEDDVAFCTPWGFDVTDIRVPVQLWHGESDTSTPVDHGRWLAAHLPSVDAHFVEGDHTTIESEHEEDAWGWLLAKSKA
jgi:pimeloyl-ACP methyl ester carboxylesterase